MSDDAGGHDTFMAALGGGDPAPGGQPDSSPTEGAPQGGLPQGEGGQEGIAQPQPEPAPQTAPSPVPRVPQADQGIPAWRLKEEADARREAQARYAEAEQRLRTFEEADRRRQAEAELKGEDFYGSDPSQFIDKRLDHRLQGVLGPVGQHLQMMQEAMRQQAADFSHQMGVQQHGADKVTQAYHRIQSAIQSRDPTALAIQARVADPRDPVSRDPTRAIMDWDRRHSVYEATGGDLDKYRQTYAEELLKDPAHLARALEAHRQQATPVQTGVTGRAPSPQSRSLPSLNRETSSRDNNSEDDMDDATALASALSAPRR